MIDKRCASVEEAVSVIRSGSVIAGGGFGDIGVPLALCAALARLDVCDLTIVSNNAGTGENGLALLFKHHCVSRLIASFPSQAGADHFMNAWRLGEVQVEAGYAIVCAVGEGLRNTAGIAGRLFGALAETNIALISQGASSTNLTFVVSEKDVEDVVRRLHERFFGSRGSASTPLNTPAPTLLLWGDAVTPDPVPPKRPDRCLWAVLIARIY